MKVYIGRYSKDWPQQRKVEVRIDKQDLWNLDHTLAQIIYPALVRLREIKHGAPFVADSDVPDELRNGKPDDVGTDEKWFDRWNWVLDEMIFAFDQHRTGDWEDQFYQGEFDRDGVDVMQARIDNGTRLFGVYYHSLWN
jgi:hypothetical protein